MNKLKVVNGSTVKYIEFEANPTLASVLESGGFVIHKPCGGRGKCGKCLVRVNGEYVKSCITAAQDGMLVELRQKADFKQIEIGEDDLACVSPMKGSIGAAIDIGTTTIAVKQYDLATGKCISLDGMLNPQNDVAADVMGRIGAAKDSPERLAHMQSEVCEVISNLAPDAESMVVTGNTTMLYLLTGKNPHSLSHAPFEADCLFGYTASITGREAYLPPCMNAFVGADISCGVMSSGMCDRDDVSLLCDIGTNGELALWKDGKLYVTSTAAGPAFEGAGISCGCGSVYGAIDSVRENEIHTIGDVKAVGVCGSGLIDAIAYFLDKEIIDETGACDGELELRDGIALMPADVRAVQLAKGAIAAGIKTLIEVSGLTYDDVKHVYIAGGFGRHLRIDSAIRIGLLAEEFRNKTEVIGNAALKGAAELLLDTGRIDEIDRIAANSEHVNLGGNPIFNNNYMECMMFPEV